MDIQQIIKERYKELPVDIQRAIKDTDLASKFGLISNKHNLHVDQNGALQTETLLVMLGLEPTEDYVGNIQKELDVSVNQATSIAEDVNDEILNSIRESLRNFEEEKELGTPKKEVSSVSVPPQSSTSNISSIEKVGGFTIEKNGSQSSSPLYKDTNLNREAVLKDIEDAGKKTSDSGVSLVDHLLKNPTSNPAPTPGVKKPEPQTTPVPVPKPPPAPAPQKYSADPYREPIE